jgi:hypothetical protein
VVRRERPGIEDRACAVEHVRPTARDIAGGRITPAYHEGPLATTSIELRRALAGRP